MAQASQTGKPHRPQRDQAIAQRIQPRRLGVEHQGRQFAERRLRRDPRGGAIMQGQIVLDGSLHGLLGGKTDHGAAGIGEGADRRPQRLARSGLQMAIDRQAPLARFLHRLGEAARGQHVIDAGANDRTPAGIEAPPRGIGEADQAFLRHRQDRIRQGAQNLFQPAVELALRHPAAADQIRDGEIKAVDRIRRLGPHRRQRRVARRQGDMPAQPLQPRMDAPGGVAQDRDRGHAGRRRDDKKIVSRPEIVPIESHRGQPRQGGHGNQQSSQNGAAPETAEQDRISLCNPWNIDLLSSARTSGRRPLAAAVASTARTDQDAARIGRIRMANAG